MKTNITLIGMPGAGKSTTGIILAKNMALGFIDTDVLIQINNGMSLQAILDETGYMNLRRMEETEILKLNIENHVIATGGSAAYSERAMVHLHCISRVVYLEVSYETCSRRIRNFDARGIARAPTQTFRDLFEERQILYRKYAEISVDCNLITQEEVAEEVSRLLIQEISSSPPS